MRYYYIVLLWLVVMALHGIQTLNSSLPDSLQADSKLLQLQKQRYEDFRNNRIRFAFPDINLLSLKNAMQTIDYESVTQSDLFQISSEFYQRYYKNDILLWNFRDAAYLNLDLKNLQNSRNLIQLDIPIPNFHLLFRREISRIDKPVPN